MAISYASKPYIANPSVSALDLNLLDKVLSFKQQKFDMGAQQAQAQIDQAASLDVMRGVDQDYVNQKTTAVVESINKLGAVDYSDINVRNQIQGMSSSIFKDRNITTAVASTQKIRAADAAYAKAKTDPKMAKLYAQQNEWEKDQQVQKYLQNTDLGTAYDGPSTIQPYVAYRDKHTALFKGLTANKWKLDTVDGWYKSTTEKKWKTAGEVAQEAMDLLLPEERAQMARDADYLFTTSGVDKARLTEKFTEQYDETLENQRKLINNYNLNLLLSDKDPQAKQQYQDLIKTESQKLKDLTDKKQNIIANFGTMYDQNRKEASTQVYAHDYFKGLGSRFAINEQSNTTNPNMAEVYRRRDDIEKAKLQLQREIAAARAAKELEAKTLPTPLVYTSTDNNDDPETWKTTFSEQKELINTYSNEMQSNLNDFIANLVSKNPQYQDPNNPTKLKGLDIFAKFNDPTKIEIEDFISASKIPDTYLMNKMNVSKEDVASIKVLGKLFTAIEDLSNGRTTYMDEIPVEAQEMVRKNYNLRVGVLGHETYLTKQLSKALGGEINEVFLKKAVSGQTDFTDEELQQFTLEDIKKIASNKVITKQSNTALIYSSNRIIGWTDAQRKKRAAVEIVKALQDGSMEDLIDKSEDKEALRFQYNRINLINEKIEGKSSPITNQIVSMLNNKNGLNALTVVEGELPEVLEPNDILGVSYGRNNKNKGKGLVVQVDFSTGKDSDKKKGSITFDPTGTNILEMIGVEKGDSVTEGVLRLNGKLPPKPIFSGKNVVNAEVFKIGNTGEVGIRILLNQNGKEYINFPLNSLGGPVTSPKEAFRRLQDFMDANKNQTHAQIIQNIKNNQ